MALRVKVKLKAKDNAIETAALVNSGYEAEGLEMALPASLAKRLGLSLRKGASKEEYYSAGGRTKAYRVPRGLEVSLLAEGRKTSFLTVDVIVLPKLDEVLISDKLSDALAIMPIRLGEGTWRLADEPDKVRASVPPERWV